MNVVKSLCEESVSNWKWNKKRIRGRTSRITILSRHQIIRIIIEGEHSKDERINKFTE